MLQGFLTTRTRGLGKAGGSQHLLIDFNKDALSPSERDSGEELNLGLVKELASFTTKVATRHFQGLVERDRPEIVDLHVAGYSKNIERAVELAHCFIKQSGYYASMDITGWAFVGAIQLEMGGCGGILRIRCIR